MSGRQRRGASQRNHQIYAMPAAIGLISTIGLVIALAGDGGYDWLSWGALAMPVAAVGWAMRVRRG